MKQLKVLTKPQEIGFLVVFLCLTVSINPSIDTPESSNDFLVLIISLIFSFGINKVNLFPVVTAPFQLTFLSNLFIMCEDKLLTNPG